MPALAAVALDAAAGAPAPRSLVLMGGPVDARRNPTVVDKLATDHPLAWFEHQMIHRVPERYAGAGRRVYPGFLQLSAFVMMNPDKHAQAYWQYWLARLRGDDVAAAQHEKFYDEYNAVLDMDAHYYLDTVRIVFQEFALARGTWRVAGELVDPQQDHARRRSSRSKASSTTSRGSARPPPRSSSRRTHRRSASSSPPAAVTTACSPDRAGARRSIPRSAPSSDSTHEP